jgi:flavin-dependent dehydrogenase
MTSVDLVVIGGGPGGLVAARTAAERGLSVALVDAKQDISRIKRTCAQIFYLSHIGGGQAYTKPVKVMIESEKKAALAFPDINLSVDYDGILRACYDWRHLSPNGTCVYTSKNKLWGFVFNKGNLLKGLLDDVEKLGVTIHRKTQGLKAENTGAGVRVEIKNGKGGIESIEANHAIVANGINSRIVENLGLNKTRQTLGEALTLLGYVMEGVDCPYPPSSWVSFAYPSITSYINVWMGPMAEGTWQLGATAKAPGSPLDTMNRFLADSHFSSWFKKAKVVWKTGCSLTPRYPIAEPVVGNIVVVGDAAAPAETWVQGAMACGHQAVKAIEEGNLGTYVTWWKESFHFNSPAYFEDFARYPALNMFFQDEELNYLYGLIEGQLVSNVGQELLKYTDRVRAEKPDVYEKLKKLAELSPGDTFKSEG